ncbi:MAG: histidinol-phosphatase [Verrucomicrobia bacterium]|nr:histidinol-phosphatase [Verrucomicrobiota bacterium]
MRIIADHHVHTTRCQHASGTMEEFVERAVERGLKAIGFADHNPLPRGLGANVRMKEAELDDYVKCVLDLRRQYEGRIEVLLGLEMDYVEGLEDYLTAQVAGQPWDYIIGSIHYLDAECTQISWPRNFTGETAWLYSRYFELVRKMVRSGLCDVVAHFDVPKRSGRAHTEHQTGDITRTLKEIVRAGICLEINTSGYRHPELRRPDTYPTRTIIAEAVALGIPLAVNSDAHTPEDVGLKFDEMERLLARHKDARLVSFRSRRQVAA